MTASTICEHCNWRPVTWTQQKLRFGYLIKKHGFTVEEAKAAGRVCSFCAPALIKARKLAQRTGTCST